MEVKLDHVLITEIDFEFAILAQAAMACAKNSHFFSCLLFVLDVVFLLDLLCFLVLFLLLLLLFILVHILVLLLFFKVQAMALAKMGHPFLYHVHVCIPSA